MIAYFRLWDMLNRKGMSKTDLKKALGCSQDTITAMTNNKPINLRTVDKICELFDCQPENILEYIPTEKNIK